MRTYCIAQGTLLKAKCDLNGKEVQMREGVYVYVWLDPCCCTVENNTTL